MTRTSPIRHRVRTHKRKERTVHSFLRGKGQKHIKVANPILSLPKIQVLPQYLIEAVKKYSDIPLTKSSYYQWEPMKSSPKFNEKMYEIIDSAWVRWANNPRDKNLQILQKHLETPTGRLCALRSLHFLWQQKHHGESLGWRGGENFVSDMDKFKTFEDWYKHGSLTIFRGIHSKSSLRPNTEAESWSLSREIGKSFADFWKTEPGLGFVKADKYKGKKSLLIKKIQPFNVLGYEDKTVGEHEVIVRYGDGKISEAKIYG